MMKYIQITEENYDELQAGFLKDFSEDLPLSAVLGKYIIKEWKSDKSFDVWLLDEDRFDVYFIRVPTTQYEGPSAWAPGRRKP